MRAMRMPMPVCVRMCFLVVHVVDRAEGIMPVRFCILSAVAASAGTLRDRVLVYKVRVRLVPLGMRMLRDSIHVRVHLRVECWESAENNGSQKKFQWKRQGVPQTNCGRTVKDLHAR